VWLSLLDGVFLSVLTSHERFDLAQAVALSVLGVQTAGTVLALAWGYGICGLAGVVIGCRALSLISNYLVARRIHPRLRVWPIMLGKSRLRELLGYGLGAFVGAVSIRVIGQTDLVVAGAAIGVASVTVYSVGAMLVYYSGAFLRFINVTLFPPIQRAVARSDMGDARWLFLRTGRLWLVFGLLVYGGLIVYAEPFIRLWMYGPGFGEESVRQAATVMRVLAAAGLPLLFVGASVDVLNAIGHVRFTASLAMAEALLNLGLSLLFVLVFGWGLVGIAGGTLAARLLVGTFIAPWYACAKAGMSWWDYASRIGGSELVGALLFVGLCFLTSRLLPVHSWAWFFGQIVLVTTGYGVIAVWLLVPAADRQRVWNSVLRWRTASETS
jgi:O-antigen/teichoic acid export membrane protein